MNDNLNFDDGNVSAYLFGLASRLHQSILTSMSRIGIHLQAYIQDQKLSGDPLAQRTGKLKGSIRFQVQDRGDTVSVQVMGGGGIAPYGAVHEYGGTFNIPRHMSMSRLGKAYSVREHQATYPQRAFMVPSLEENEDLYYEMTQQAAYEVLGE